MYTSWIVAQAAPPNGNVIVTMLPLVFIFFIFWVLVYRPQQKEQQKQQAFLNTLKVGDEVVTAGGLFGKIVTIDVSTLMIEISRGTRVRVARQQVRPVQSVLAEEVETKKKDEALLETDDKSEKEEKKSKKSSKKDSHKNDSADGDNAW